MSDPKPVRLAGSVLAPHRHVCAFFRSKAEEYRVLLPFIKDGLERGDRAFHIVDRRRRGDHVRRMEEADIDVAGTERSGQLEIRPWEEAYLQDGFFDVERMMDFVEGLLNRGTAQGSALTRLVASMEWALEDCPGAHRLVEYESRLNDMLMKHDAAVCCTYDVTRFSAPVVMDVLRTHPVVIVGGILQENPFFTPPDEFLRELREREVKGSPCLT